MKHFEKHSFDQMMLLLDTNPNKPKRKIRFIYDNRWSKRPGCSEVVKDSRKITVERSRMYQFHRKIKNVKNGLLE